MPGFTDEPVTPVRLQILIDVLLQSTRGIRRDDLCRLLQPEALAGKDSKFPSATATIRAALDLELADESGGIISLIPAYRKEKHPNSVILKAFDVRVLSVLRSKSILRYFILTFSVSGLASISDRSRATTLGLLNLTTTYTMTFRNRIASTHRSSPDCIVGSASLASVGTIQRKTFNPTHTNGFSVL
jgi:hypothetical protein